MSKIDKVIGNNDRKGEIIPYNIVIPDERAIRTRVESYDWNLIPDTGAWRSGVGIEDLRRLVDYWLNQYDWRKVERHLNLQPHFTTDIDGERIHFIHIQGNKSKPPLLLLHGWPGSFIEFEKLLAPLSADGHDIIIPSLPGFAFSTPVTGIIGMRRAAELMHSLMARLSGESRYIVQGGDWGANIASWMAYLFPNSLLGIHVNMVSIYAADTKPTTPEEIDLFSRRDKILDWETGYSHEQETRPQTLGIAMADSPVGYFCRHHAHLPRKFTTSCITPTCIKADTLLRWRSRNFC
jgi:microsomal epoxide hydrolase